MKILHICEYTMGGIATYIQQVLEYQQQEHDVYLILSRNNSKNNFNINKENIYFYDYVRHPKYFLKAIREISKFVNKVQPDIIHIHSSFAGLFARLPLFLTRKKAKVVYCSHGWSFLMDTSPLKKKVFVLIEKILSYKTDITINISEYEHKESIKMGLPEDKSIVIHNGVRPSSNLVEIDLPIDKNKINLLFIGRFDYQKGIDILLDIFKNYNFSNLHLYTFGNSVLSKQKLTYSIKNVTNLGWIDNSMIDSYYNLFDAVIIPSRWEGFGLVAVEAMRNKKAVIASNKGALPELVQNNINGYIFDLNSPQELVHILNNLDKPTLKRLGENGYLIYKEKFRSDIMNKKILEQYERLICN